MSPLFLLCICHPYTISVGTRTNSRSVLQRGQYSCFRFSLDAAAGRPLGAVSCNPHSGHSNVRSPKLYCGNPISITVLAPDGSIGRPPRYEALQILARLLAAFRAYRGVAVQSSIHASLFPGRTVQQDRYLSLLLQNRLKGTGERV